jgi:Ran GTPase-activating protein (RanGAP) involved in mRNA processing and transport
MISHNAATLRHVRVATTRLSLKGGGGMALAKALCEVKELHHLDLSDNAIGSEAGHVLVDGCLLRATSLRSLILGDTGFDAAVLRKLFALANLHTLEVGYKS